MTARTGILVATILCATAAAQRSTLERQFDTNFAALDSEREARDAVRALVNLGPSAVPLLRDRLAETNRAREPLARLSGALFVLARIGKPAIAAWPEVLQVYEVEARELQPQASWTIVQLLPWADGDQRAELQQCHRRLERSRSRDRSLALWTMRAQLDIDGNTHLDKLLAMLGIDAPDDPEQNACDAATISAASSWLGAHRRADASEHDTAVGALTTTLQRLLDWPPLPWRTYWVDPVAAGPVSLALRTLTGASFDSLTARGALYHWDPDERLRAAWWFAEHGASVPLRERAELLTALFDRDAEVARTAARALGNWGTAGVVGLPALRRLAATTTDVTFASLCREQAERIVAASASDPAPARTVLAIDAALRADATAPATAFDGDAELVAQALTGAQWADETHFARTLAAAALARVPADVAAPWIMAASGNADPAVGDLALAWMAHHPPAVTAVMAGLPFSLREAVLSYVPQASRGAAAEALAWIEVPSLPTGEALEAHLGSGNLRLACRALAATLAVDPARLKDSRGHLHKLVQLSKADHDWIEWPGLQLEAQTRLLAAIALCSFGDLEFDATLVAETVRKECGVEVLDLPAWVTAQREHSTLAAFLDGVEASCRERLSVRHGVWPTVR